MAQNKSNEYLFNSDMVYGQAQIGELIGLSVRQVRNLQNSGVLPKAKGRNGLDPLSCIHAYIAYKSTEPDKDVDVAEEKKRALVLKNNDLEERIKLSQIKRLVLEKEYAPIEMITDTIAQLATGIRTRVDSWLPKLKMIHPDMTGEQIDMLKHELAILLNELTDVKPNFHDYEDSDLESGLAGIETIEGDDSNDRSRVVR